MLWRQREMGADFLAPPTDGVEYALPSEDGRRDGTAQEAQSSALDQWTKALRAAEVMTIPPASSIPWPAEFETSNWMAEQTPMSEFARDLLAQIYKRAGGVEELVCQWLTTPFSQLPDLGCTIVVQHLGRAITLGQPSSEEPPDPAVPRQEWTCWEERLEECRREGMRVKLGRSEARELPAAPDVARHQPAGELGCHGSQSRAVGG